MTTMMPKILTQWFQDTLDSKIMSGKIARVYLHAPGRPPVTVRMRELEWYRLLASPWAIQVNLR